LARVGGDEFAIVLTDPAADPTDKSSHRSAARRILTAFEHPVQVGSLTLTSSASVGLAFADQHTSSAADLLRNADLATCAAKRDGGGRVAEYKPILHTAALRRTQLEAELRVALHRGEFLLHYQPIVALPSESLIGTEALIRWQHPTRGLLAPAEFITAAEQSGLIVSLGAWVLRTACRQTADWQLTDPGRAPLNVAVNLSPRAAPRQHPRRHRRPSTPRQPARRGSLCLEITETAVLENHESTLPTLNALRKLGVSLALDDFGTGYSSPSYLKQAPDDSVKIDQSFVADLDDDEQSPRIVHAIIELGHAMGLSVTAEGTETDAQLTALKAMHCDRAQGYLLSRPMTDLALTDILVQQPPAAHPPIPTPRQPPDRTANTHHPATVRSPPKSTDRSRSSRDEPPDPAGTGPTHRRPHRQAGTRSGSPETSNSSDTLARRHLTLLSGRQHLTDPQTGTLPAASEQAAGPTSPSGVHS
jgi:EAL domain-containing protein (putative c-di-GMP-specific phosphodiesterase class I)